MKKKLFKIFSSFALVASIIFFSCEKNEVNIDEHSHVDKNKISFKEFLNKTQIKKFKFEISTNSSTNQSLVNRQSSDFISFVVDTTLVKQRIQISGNYTFTLPVIPVPYQNTESLFYNIVFYKANNAWQWSVLEYQKEGNNEFNVTEIVNDFNHNGLLNMRLQGVWGTITTFNCVGCKGACDLCPQCVSTTTTYDLATLDDPTSKFEIIEGTGNNNNGATSVNVGMALADNFANTQLTPEQKLIYDLNPSIREYLSNNKIVVSNPNYNPLLGGDPTMAVIDPQVVEFVLELLDFYNEENIIGENDLKGKIRQAIANGITSTAEFTHKIFKKFSNLAEEYPSSITYINSVLETINDAVAIVTNTNPATCTFADLFNMWLFELGPNPININGSNTTSTNQLKIQEGVNQARQDAIENFQNGDFSQVSNGWSYGQAQFYDGMTSGNLVTAFLGSYTTKVNIVSTSSGYALSFYVTNTSSWDSATRFRIDNDNNGVHDGIFPNTVRTNRNDLSMGGNFKQNWYWLEPLN